MSESSLIGTDQKKKKETKKNFIPRSTTKPRRIFTLSPTSSFHDVILPFTTERNRITLSIFPWFNYATKPENRNKTLSFKWIPAGSGNGKYLGISALSLSLSSSLQIRRWPVNWKNYSCYMYGFGDRIVRGGRHVAILFDWSGIASVGYEGNNVGERVPCVDSRGLSFVGFSMGNSNFPLMVEAIFH